MTPDPAGAGAICSHCGFPVIRTARGIEHASAADAVFCSIFAGIPLTVTEDE